MRYAAWDGMAWNERTLQEFTDHSPLFFVQSSNAVDSSGNPHILYSTYDVMTGDHSFVYGYWDGVEWRTTPIEDSSYDNPALVLDSMDRPHMVYVGGGNPRSTLHYVYWDGDTWIKEDVDTYLGLPSMAGTSLRLDANDLPQIAYVDAYDEVEGVLGREVKWAHKVNGQWVSELVGDGVGEDWVSLSLDPFGNPHIAYRDGVDLEYAVGVLPEPATLSLLALGGLALIRRR